MNVDEDVCVKEYDPKWAMYFQKENQKLCHELEKYNCHIEHIGSTSVVGMYAKPIIDILIGVDNFPPSDDLIQTLVNLDYEYMKQASVPDRLYFVKRGDTNFNVHIVRYESNIWIKDIEFREFLRTTPQAVKEYSALKRAIIGKGKNKLLAYSEEKAPFIIGVLRQLD